MILPIRRIQIHLKYVNLLPNNLVHAGGNIGVGAYFKSVGHKFQWRETYFSPKVQNKSEEIEKTKSKAKGFNLRHYPPNNNVFFW